MSDTLVRPSAEAADKSRAARLLGQALRSREIAVFAVLVLLLVVATIANPRFLVGSDGWRDLLVTPSILLLLAVGQTAVIITRNVDLSVGSTVGLTAYAVGKIFVEFPGIPVVVVFVIGALIGAVLGLINGALVAFGRVPALVVTLGTMYIYRGVFLEWAGSDRINAGDLPGRFLSLGTKQVLTIPVLTIIALVVLAVVGFYLRSMRSGREFYAIGSDPAAARLYGLPVTRRVLGAFILCGALAGLAGVFYAARYGTVSSGAGRNLELESVAAAVIGGVAIFGGTGTVWGAGIGAFLLVTIDRVLPLLGISDFWQRAVVGALIIAAVALDRVLSLRRERQLKQARDEARNAS
ncbi:ABC transporter permease [Nocardioides insulae]|uniref:ABC transporter permease n=1 Tax=Nocardioides insulae TaxID=394734 RepID=UPI000407F28D|nr:ABC transporter permease [Nocardioides insulae]